MLITLLFFHPSLFRSRLKSFLAVLLVKYRGGEWRVEVPIGVFLETFGGFIDLLAQKRPLESPDDFRVVMDRLERLRFNLGGFDPERPFGNISLARRRLDVRGLVAVCGVNREGLVRPSRTWPGRDAYLASALEAEAKEELDLVGGVCALVKMAKSLRLLAKRPAARGGPAGGRKKR